MLNKVKKLNEKRENTTHYIYEMLQKLQHEGKEKKDNEDLAYISRLSKITQRKVSRRFQIAKRKTKDKRFFKKIFLKNKEQDKQK